MNDLAQGCIICRHQAQEWVSTQDFCSLNTFLFHEMGNQKVKELLKSLDSRRSTGEDQIPPKLVSLASNELSSALTMAINCSIRNSRFPDDAKRQRYVL